MSVHVLAVATVAILAALGVLSSVVVVRSTDRAVVVRDGEVQQVLDSGVHVRRPGATVASVPVAGMTVSQPCEATTVDGTTVEVVVDVEFAVTDVRRAAGYEGWTAPDAWKRALQRCIHDATGAAVGDGTLTAVREGTEIERAVADALADLAPDLGIDIDTVAVSDVRERADTN